MLMGDGIDNWQVFSLGKPSRRTEMIHVTQAAGSVLEAEALRVGEMKLLWHPAGTDCSVSHSLWYPPPGLPWDYANFTVRCPKPPVAPEPCTKKQPCLYNITADPCEQLNLAPRMPAVVDKLAARLAEYRETAVLSWKNFDQYDPRSDPSRFGPLGEYRGVVTPWRTDAQAAAFYPSNYSGPGAPTRT